ncbi:MAG: hypothetical protein WCK89_21210 [bacterium]
MASMFSTSAPRRSEADSSFLGGSLIVSKFHQLALCRQEQRASDRRPFYLYIDEFPYFVTPSMASILSGVRKYQLGLVLAHQEMRQLGKDSEIGSAILANPYARVCFRLGDQDAARLASGFTFFDAKDLQNLGTGEAIARIERAEYDFNLRIEPLPEIDSESSNGTSREGRQVNRSIRCGRQPASVLPWITTKTTGTISVVTIPAPESMSKELFSRTLTRRHT